MQDRFRAVPIVRKNQIREWIEKADAAIGRGDLDAAKRCILSAIRADPSSSRLRFDLGVVLDTVGEAGGAAEAFCQALRLDPAAADAARRLGDILARGTLPDGVHLDDRGMVAALAHTRVDRDLFAAAAVRHAARGGTLRRALDRGRNRGWLESARELLHSAAVTGLGGPLLRTALAAAPVVDPGVEHLLTAVRRIALLELPRARLAEPGLVPLMIALVAQGWRNEHVWAETDEEVRALEPLAAEADALLRRDAADTSGDPAAGVALLLHALYRAPETLAAFQSADLTHIQPPALAALLADRQDELRALARHVAAVADVGPVTDATSLAVGAQYEASPYPRWTAVPVLKAGQHIKQLQRIFRLDELAFARRPFEVLVAGCGTGRQAVSAAIDWGPDARVTGLDISRASLGWGGLMAERMSVANLRLARGDILDVARFSPGYAGRFHVIECSGVLHHMADPFDAWRRLLGCLAPGGIMLIGLYSAVARRNLDRLRQDPASPGPGADAAALRRWRRTLLDRPRDAPGSELLRSRDVHSASGFRDFFLNVNETTTTLPAIAAFMAAERLDFRGFVGLPFEALAAEHPAATRPGTLLEWAAWEARHPNAFLGMYQLWCTRR